MLETIPDVVRIAAHAKVNLFLRVLSLETTGYHSIETLFCLLELADELTVERISRGVQLELDGSDTGPPEENLAVTAAREMLHSTGDRFGVRILLQKNIPVRAGLGGGSSDAAAALHAVNLLAGSAVPRHELMQFAARIGSDIPFFACGAAMALGWNRGERLFRISPPSPAAALLTVPPVGVSTAEAYRALDRVQGDPQPRGSVLLEADSFQTWGGIARLGGNDFEAVVSAREPRIRGVFEEVANTGPLLVRMSGSGSAVVGIFRTERDLEDAAEAVGGRDRTIIKTATRSSPAPGPVAAAGARM